jgi:CheY-like chemotaxis protein
MGGLITASGAPGKGATFTVRLQLPRAEKPDAARDDRPPCSGDHSAAGAEGPLKPATSAMGGTLHPLVLIAEDNEINALLARRIVEKAGCEPVVVGNGRDAVGRVSASLAPGAQPFDLILMDVFMPELDGIGATHAIRDLFSAAQPDIGAPPPIIALTANAFAEDRRRCLEAGMSDYLAKPFDVQDLQRLLAQWVGRELTGDGPGLKRAESGTLPAA